MAQEAVQAFRAPGWRAWACSIQGAVRADNQDAWCVATDVASPDGPVHVFGVFDGVGGMPNGRAASVAAANAVVKGAGEVGLDALLRAANGPVRATGGGTTAVVVGVAQNQDGPLRVLSVGDSSLYVLDGRGRPFSAAPQDAGVGHQIRDFLGNDAMVGHVSELDLAAGATMVLCTDGVDRIVGATGLTALLKAEPEGMEAAIEAVLAAVRAGGAPDNATLVVVSRDR